MLACVPRQAGLSPTRRVVVHLIIPVLNDNIIMGNLHLWRAHSLSLSPILAGDLDRTPLRLLARVPALMLMVAPRLVVIGGRRLGLIPGRSMVPVVITAGPARI